MAARAALITRGLAEMTRLGLALGAKADTFMGLSGLGDLVLTATGDLSRNRRVGLALAQGKTLVTVLHDIQYALRANHIVMLKQGHLHYEGASEDPATHQALIALFEGRIRLEKLGNDWVSLPA